MRSHTLHILFHARKPTEANRQPTERVGPNESHRIYSTWGLFIDCLKNGRVMNNKHFLAFLFWWARNSQITFEVELLQYRVKHPDLAPSDYYLFANFKWMLQGNKFR